MTNLYGALLGPQHEIKLTVYNAQASSVFNREVSS